MATGNTTENDLLKLIYNGTTPAWAAGNIKVALHTADPTAAGTQTSNAATYTGYAQATVPATGSYFTITGSNVTNATDITFPQNTGSSQTITHVSFGNGTQIFHFGPITGDGVVDTGVTPKILAGSLALTRA